VLRSAPYVLIALALLFGMLVTFPAVDDVLFEYLIALHGPESLYDGLLERPVSGVLWTALARHDMFWWPQIITNVLCWLVLAWISTWLFAWVFPDSRRVAIAAGLFAISPLLLELNFIIACSYIPINALAQLPIVLLLSNYRRAITWCLALAVSLTGLFAAALVSEYAVATAAGITVLLIAKAYFANEPRQRRRDLISMVLLVAPAFAAYGVFVSIRDPDFRPGVESGHLFAEGLARFVKLPFRLVSSLYTATAGALFRELAVINVNSKETILGTLFGLLVAGMAVVGMGTNRAHGSRAERPFGGYEWPVLLMAFTAAMLPALLMGRRPDDTGFASRFFFPALPIAALMTVDFLKRAIAGHRDWVVVGVIGFVAGYATLSEALVEQDLNGEMTSWGDAIRPYVDEQGTTVAVVLLGKNRFEYVNLDDEMLTSRIGRSWPVELRRRFYATDSLDEVGPSEASARRGAVLDYPITRVLLVMPKGVGNGVTISEIDKDHLPADRLTRPQFKSPPPRTAQADAQASDQAAP